MKIEISDLAVFGGRPAFETALHVGRPNIGDRARLISRIDDMLDRRWLTNNGPYVQEFEKQIADYVGVKHCIAVCNATIGLEIASRALGLNGEVIIPSFTFIATAHALQWQEITPVFCDIDPATHNIDPNAIETLITPRTTGILGVHVWGRPCDINALHEIANRRHLHLMFDAAHAFGCSFKGRMIGNFGDLEVFSFHATKFLNSFEGGAITTNSDELAGKIRFMVNFGFAGYDQVAYLGINGKMTEVCAIMGLTSLESLTSIIEVNFKNFLHYKEQLGNLPGISLVEYETSEMNNYQYVIIEVDEGAGGAARDLLVRILHAENILARRYFYPGCHQMEPYKSYFPHASLLLQETERLSLRVLSLPTGTAVGLKEIEEVCQIIRFVIEHESEIRDRMGGRHLL
jgi:dTDP-4-amino-4,6-dideoxygalactose transaminase